MSHYVIWSSSSLRLPPNAWWLSTHPKPDDPFHKKLEGVVADRSMNNGKCELGSEKGGEKQLRHEYQFFFFFFR